MALPLRKKGQNGALGVVDHPTPRNNGGLACPDSLGGNDPSRALQTRRGERHPRSSSRVKTSVAMAETLQVEKRTGRGKRHNRDLRRAEKLPAILYGPDSKGELGEGSVSLTLQADQLSAMLRHGAKVVDLEGAASGKALLQAIQWDTFYQYVLHVDLLRLQAGQKISVEMPVELRGESPGTREGGIVEQTVRAVQIEVSPEEMPERLHINVNHLNLGESLLASDIEDLPAGAKLLTDPATVVVHCVLPTVVPDEDEEGVSGSMEPEIIGQKSDEEGEGDDKK